jgi:hypothetical protein
VPNEFVIGEVVLKLLIKRLAVAMVNKPVMTSPSSISELSTPHSYFMYVPLYI